MSSSSGHNLNSFPYFPSSSTSYNLPLTLPSLHNYESLGNNNNNIFNIHQPHQHQDPVSFLTPYLPISHHYSQLSAATTPENFINFAVSNNIQLQSLGNIPDLLAKSAPMAAAKKDRHSKIYTAQGLRDRRVRLSIDIARKFFDLQDMLGYDKASKTLEWLFGKSRKAIKELSKTKNGNVCFNGGKKASMVSDIENPDDNDDDNDDDEDQGGSGLKRDLEEKPSKVEVFQQLPARESRAKARAKAREKQGEDISNHWKILDSNLATSENSIEESSMIKRKLCAKKFIDDTKMSHHENEISQWKLLDQIKASKGMILEEPSMIKRKFRPSIISGSSQRNLVFSFDSIPINFTQNWDTNNNPNCPFNK